MLRGEVQLTSLSPAVREMLAITGWERPARPTAGSPDHSLRHSSWHSRRVRHRAASTRCPPASGAARSTCRLHGRPGAAEPDRRCGPADCDVVTFPATSFGLGLGAIGGD